MKRLLWLSLLMTVLGSAGVTTGAQAATWHHGTPKVLRGLYQSTTPVGKHSAAGFAPVITVTAKSFGLSISNNPLQLVKHLKYQHVHGHYQFKGKLQHIGFVKGGKVTFGLKKKGHSLYFMQQRSNSFTMPDRFKRTAHVKG